MFEHEPRLLYDPIRYIMDGGKRLRHDFVVRTAGLWGAAEDALPAAEAVEMFHNFTLLHDDIMDNAPLRRGRESVFGKWGANVAILSGDALMILAYRRLGELRAELLPRVLACFNEAAIAVCEGQRMDMDCGGDYLMTVERKTAALFVGAVSMGAVIGGASADDIARLREFALQFGIAFQIQDDLLDCYGDARLGKTLGGDIAEGKLTFLSLQVPAEELVATGRDVARVMALYESYGVRRRAEEEIERRFALAVNALDGLSVSGEGLREFAIGQLGRSK